jgi:hypothetical protein
LCLPACALLCEQLPRLSMTADLPQGKLQEFNATCSSSGSMHLPANYAQQRCCHQAASTHLALPVLVRCGLLLLAAARLPLCPRAGHALRVPQRLLDSLRSPVVPGWGQGVEWTPRQRRPQQASAAGYAAAAVHTRLPSRTYTCAASTPQAHREAACDTLAPTDSAAAPRPLPLLPLRAICFTCKESTGSRQPT